MSSLMRRRSQRRVPAGPRQIAKVEVHLRETAVRPSFHRLEAGLSGGGDRLLEQELSAGVHMRVHLDIAQPLTRQCDAQRIVDPCEVLQCLPGGQARGSCEAAPVRDLCQRQSAVACHAPRFAAFGQLGPLHDAPCTARVAGLVVNRAKLTQGQRAVLRRARRKQCPPLGMQSSASLRALRPLPHLAQHEQRLGLDVGGRRRMRESPRGDQQAVRGGNVRAQGAPRGTADQRHRPPRVARAGHRA